MSDLSSAVLMFIAYRDAENRIFSGLADLGYDDVTLAQGRLFSRIAEDGSRASDLAAAGQVTKQTAGYLIDQLERLGYVERVPDPTDGRSRLVRAASRGRAARAEAQRIAGEIEAEWRAHLGPRRHDQLRAALATLREITDPWA